MQSPFVMDTGAGQRNHGIDISIEPLEVSTKTKLIGNPTTRTDYGVIEINCENNPENKELVARHFPQEGSSIEQHINSGGIDKRTYRARICSWGLIGTCGSVAVLLLSLTVFSSLGATFSGAFPSVQHECSSHQDCTSFNYCEQKKTHLYGAIPGSSGCVECSSLSLFQCGAAGHGSENRCKYHYVEHICLAGKVDTNGFIGDGRCNENYNIEELDWDGGDCCLTTCNAESFHKCEGSRECQADCLDPFARMPKCKGENDNVLEQMEEMTRWRGDGHCDGFLNNADSEWDGGDCCFSTCRDSAYPCGRIACGSPCLDPDGNDLECSELDEDADDTSSSSKKALHPECSGAHGNHDWIHDGQCDPANNNPECGYDGGDCCKSTCEDGPLLTCEEAGVCAMECLDPNENDDGC